MLKAIGEFNKMLKDPKNLSKNTKRPKKVQEMSTRGFTKCGSLQEGSPNAESPQENLLENAESPQEGLPESAKSSKKIHQQTSKSTREFIQKSTKEFTRKC
ncbi:hypothetical protein F8M41_013511 [Gigaspora margarita]|uniref:Uncharacterized protein n=1 Tax=Gigaspora margarita TaxID=4874 RepID=A0A8H3WY91_GIGMA|nr:hypothetical protein F8M41_013511 [Gigaspora margarita]